jgi:hypothetical protein
LTNLAADSVMADLFQHVVMIVKSGNVGNSLYSDRHGAKKSPTLLKIFQITAVRDKLIGLTSCN